MKATNNRRTPEASPFDRNFAEKGTQDPTTPLEVVLFVRIMHTNVL